jgi:two-component system osmolarity sensor histidine kinase EnvZ
MRQNLVDRQLARALEDRVQRPFIIDSRSLEKFIEIHVQLAEGVLHVVVSRRRLFSSTTYVFLLWMVGTSLALLAVATLFMRNQVKPIRRLAQAADDFGKGREVADFRAEGATEVALAGQAFNQMRSRIRRQIVQRTEMLAGVSHDLRTPLTRMKLQLAMMGEGSDIGDLQRDVDDMERMIGAYLAFARGEGLEAPTPTDLVELVSEAASGARRQGADIALVLPARSIVVPLRRDAFRRTLDNVIGNAQRYAGRIDVTLALKPRHVEILVDDDGPGIPAGAREDVFKPFFRLEQSRNQETGGTGLGLTIARDIMRSHGGDLVLTDAPGGGLRALLRLPL